MGWCWVLVLLATVLITVPWDARNCLEPVSMPMNCCEPVTSHFGTLLHIYKIGSISQAKLLSTDSIQGESNLVTALLIYLIEVKFRPSARGMSGCLLDTLISTFFVYDTMGWKGIGYPIHPKCVFWTWSHPMLKSWLKMYYSTESVNFTCFECPLTVGPDGVRWEMSGGWGVRLTDPKGRSLPLAMEEVRQDPIQEGTGRLNNHEDIILGT